MTKEVLQEALELLAVATFITPKLQAKRTAVINAGLQALAEQPAQQEPVALKWQQAPVKTQWGDEMVVASVAIDKDHTVCLYCERDQAPKVDAMFAQRTWVGLTDSEIQRLGDLDVDSNYFGLWYDFAKSIEAKLKEKNT